MEEKQLLIANILLRGIRRLISNNKSCNDLLEKLGCNIRLSNEVENLIKRSEDLAGLVSADTLVPLTPALARISFDGNYSTNYCFPFGMLQAKKESLCPIKSGSSALNSLSSSMEEYLQILVQEVKKYPNLLLPSLLDVLEKFGWCVSVSPRGDIPLYDVVKTAAAIAVCLYQKEKECPPFLLVGGGITGIQRFIYQVSNPQSLGGTSKRLRGRSLYVSLLCELVPRQILHNMGEYPHHILLSAGGKFMLLVPNTTKNREIFLKTQREIDQWLIQNFEGELSLIIVCENGKEKDIENFSGFYSRLDISLACQKKRQFNSTLSSGKEVFPINISGPKRKRLCRSCRVMIVAESENSDEEICETCKTSHSLGERLPKIRGLVFINNPYIKVDENTPHTDFGPLGKIIPIEDFESPVKLALSQPWPDYYYNEDNARDQLFTCFFPKHVATACQDLPPAGKNNTEVVRAGQVLSFEHLAAMSIGDKKLGFLKMDVDLLGMLFSLCFGDSPGQIARVLALSRELSYFSPGLLNILCELQAKEWEKKDKDLFYDLSKVSSCFYTTYAGGDDLLIIGPASEIPYLAWEIRANFKKYCGDNPDVDISAGIFFCGCKYPVPKAVEYAGEALEQSKLKGRKRITLFSHTMEWGEFNQTITMGEEIYKFLIDKDTPLSRGFVQQALAIRDIYSPEGHNHVPLLVYQIARNIKSEEQRKYFQEKLVCSTECSKIFQDIGVSLKYALMKSRKE